MCGAHRYGRDRFASAAWAVPYYEVGDSNLATGNQSLRFMYASGTKQLLFPSNIQNLVTGPSGDAMLADSVTQSIPKRIVFRHRRVPEFTT